jgi:hypothetical protein
MSKADEHQYSLMLHFAQQAKAKYDTGVLEHGEGLWNLTDDQLIEAAYEEVIDLMHYLTTLIQNRKARKNNENVL